MDKDTGKWNLVRFKELSGLMENDMLKNEAKIIETACYDGNITLYKRKMKKKKIMFNVLRIYNVTF